MSRQDKVIRRWLQALPKSERREIVFGVLRRHGFQEPMQRGGGSHYVWTHEKLKGHPDFLGGMLTVAVRGKQVTGHYVRDVLAALRAIGELDE